MDLDFEGYDGFDDYGDYDDYGDLEEAIASRELSEQEITELEEMFGGDIPPEVMAMIEKNKQGFYGPTELAERVPFLQLTEDCVIPSTTQAVSTILPLMVYCLIFHLIVYISQRISDKKDYSVLKSFVHTSSLLLGLATLYSFFHFSSVYLVISASLSYVLLIWLSRTRQNLCAVVVTVFIVTYSIICELILDTKSWHKLRGAQIILSMKIVSLSIDMSKESDAIVPGPLEYFGYCLHVGTVIFGPWLSYANYLHLINFSYIENKVLLVLQIFVKAVVSLLCLLYSNCFTSWIILDGVNKWFLAYRDAQSFRFSHYFVCFTSDLSSSLSGYSPTTGPLQWNVVKPLDIELPRSLVDVVTSWNLPMHAWLKNYIFKSVLPYGTFLAVISTYIASSLLHGLNFQLSAVLLSLGFYSYSEYVLRKKLCKIFDACVGAKKCKEKCDHKYTSKNFIVKFVNLCFGLLAMFHLAYLGLMFDSSDGQDQGYTMWHTLGKWSSLSYVSHWIALSTFIFYKLV